MSDWPFGHLRPFSYGLVMIDPPLAFLVRSVKGEGKSPQKYYRRTMTPTQVRAMPVRHLLQDDAWIWLWVYTPMLPEALGFLDAWRCKFVTAGTWTKRRGNGNLHMGTGFVLRGASEIFLVGKIGQPRVCSHSIRTVIDGPLREHSRKPDQAYAAAEALAGPVRKADVFSRQERAGWDVFGDEVGIFDSAAEGQPFSPMPAAHALVSP